MRHSSDAVLYQSCVTAVTTFESAFLNQSQGAGEHLARGEPRPLTGGTGFDQRRIDVTWCMEHGEPDGG